MMSQFAREIIEENKQTWLRQGRQEGIQIGEQRNHQKGAAALLLRQLRRRFESLPGWVEERVAAAKAADIERWGDRVLTAQSLEEVFAA
ncbi:MAG: DUF4351 domain-containing protein [Magnetococcales bacterium]|nr:DUF4351 domain-containing protein [Magnetococcales bacterium]